MRSFLRGLAAAAALTMGAGVASAEVIFVEDFEGPNGQGAFTSFTPVGNVTVANGATYNPCCGTDPAYTNNFAAFGGGNIPSGLVFEGLSTVVGRQYRVTFDFGAISANRANGPTDPLTMSIGLLNAGGTSVTYSTPSTNDLPNAFTRQTFNFTATSAVTNLGFTSAGTANVDAILDNVSVGVVPEPATWAMMIVGVGGIGGAMRVRRRSRTLAAA